MFAKYLSLLFGPILLLIAGILVFSYLQGLDSIDGLYFVLISMTTIGYGDICPEETFAKLAAVVFLPVATSALASTISGAGLVASQQESVAASAV